jgi:hypothetical protein
MVVRGVAAVVLVAAGAAIGTGTNRLLTRSAESDRESCSPVASPAAKITISLLPYSFGKIDERCSTAARLIIELEPDLRR